MAWMVSILLIAGLGLVLLSALLRGATAVPGGRLIFLDTSAEERYAQTLHDPDSGLTGRPDYLLKKGRGLVPVELKSGHSPSRPHLSHLLQLAGYCLLVQAAYRSRPRYGILKYADRAWEVPYTRRSERKVRAILAELRKAKLKGKPGRSHGEPQRCRACGHRSHCDQRI